MALPLIVAGPIVRRVEPELATVWVALSEACNVKLHVYAGPTMAESTIQSKNSLVESPMTPTRAFGEGLHIIALTVEPDPLLGPNQLYSYDLAIHPMTGTGPFDLKTLGLLADEQSQTGRTQGGVVHDDAPLNLALGYVTDQLPSFLTCPEDLDDLRLVQAGCRNSASATQDAAGWIDEVIGDARFPRPHQLLMTGDQVYADSFNTAMLKMANEIGAELVGENVTETMLAVADDSVVGHPGANQEIAMNLDNFPVFRRSFLCKDHARLTTGASNHLLGFGEFAAAYCMAWNPSIWRTIATEPQIFLDNEPETSLIAEYLTPWEHHRADGKYRMSDQKWRRHREKAYDKWLYRAEVYRSTIPQVRRALANCATYMMHDDHEITDDWNASREWADRVYTPARPLGRRILRNGMSANAIFQAWGNDPKAWESGNKADFLTALSVAWTNPLNGEVPDRAEITSIDRAIRLPPADGSHDPELIEWHFEVNAKSHKLVVVDTRTKRSFATRSGPARLLGKSLPDQVPSRSAGSTDTRLLVLMAPQPPLFPALFDQIAQPIAGAIVSYMAANKNAGKQDRAPHELSEQGDTKLEGESWGLEYFGLEELLNQIEGYKKALIISGDVHFSYAMEMDYWKKASTTGPSRYVQLTVSPSRHQWSPAAVDVLLRTSGLVSRFAELGHPAERLGWTSSGSVPQSASQLPYGLAARAKRSPALLPAKGWPAGTTVPNPPDWTWRLDIVPDVRADVDRPDSIQLPDLPPNDMHASDPTNPLASYSEMAQAHQGQTKTQFTHLRRLVFPTAIGVISFEDVDGRQHVRQEIWTGDPTHPENVNRNATHEPNTVHLIDLEPTSDDEPVVQIGTGGGN